VFSEVYVCWMYAFDGWPEHLRVDCMARRHVVAALHITCSCWVWIWVTLLQLQLQGHDTDNSNLHHTGCKASCCSRNPSQQLLF
jgi:hypothetical protein